jgi:molybdate transport system permease protein
VLAFARALGEFGATIVLAGNVAGETRTIPVAVYTLLNVRDGEAAAMRLVAVSVVLSLVALLVSFWLSARKRSA